MPSPRTSLALLPLFLAAYWFWAGPAVAGWSFLGLALVALVAALLLERRRRRVIGWTTTFPGLKLYRDYVEGRISLEEYRRARLVATVRRPIYEDELK